MAKAGSTTIQKEDIKVTNKVEEDNPDIKKLIMLPAGRMVGSIFPISLNQNIHKNSRKKKKKGSRKVKKRAYADPPRCVAWSSITTNIPKTHESENEEKSILKEDQSTDKEE